MESVNKFQSLVILLMVAIGILLGQIEFIQTYAEYLITPFLMVMLFLVDHPVLLFFVINFCVGRLVGRVMKLNYEDSVALNLTTLARNSPIALAIAVATFPDRPLISLALIIGPLIELPVLFLIAKILLDIREKQLKIA